MKLKLILGCVLALSLTTIAFADSNVDTNKKPDTETTKKMPNCQHKKTFNNENGAEDEDAESAPVLKDWHGWT